jgi:hypothetical protein
LCGDYDDENLFGFDGALLLLIQSLSESADKKIYWGVQKQTSKGEKMAGSTRKTDALLCLNYEHHHVPHCTKLSWFTTLILFSVNLIYCIFVQCLFTKDMHGVVFFF